MDKDEKDMGEGMVLSRLIKESALLAESIFKLTSGRPVSIVVPALFYQLLNTTFYSAEEKEDYLVCIKTHYDSLVNALKEKKIENKPSVH